MKTLHLTLLAFCHILLAAFILYTTIASAATVTDRLHAGCNPKNANGLCSTVARSVQAERVKPVPEAVEQVAQLSPDKHVEQSPSVIEKKSLADFVVAPAKPVGDQVVLAKTATVVEHEHPVGHSHALSHSGSPQVPHQSHPIVPPVVQHHQPAVAEGKQPIDPVVSVRKEQVPVITASVAASPVEPINHVVPLKTDTLQSVSVPGSSVVVHPPVVEQPKSVVTIQQASIVHQNPTVGSIVPLAEPKKPIAHQSSVLTIPQVPVVANAPKRDSVVSETQQTLIAPASVSNHPVAVVPVLVPVQASVQQVVPVQASVEPLKEYEVKVDSAGEIKQQAAKLMAPPAVQNPLVKGGLGPLHLLASTLCGYQPERPVSDEALNQLYIRRASVRKSLFDFMSLKFTNLEKFSSRLNAGLEIVPRKASQLGEAPSHGWPLVGKCTAHDLRLMAEAAWCEIGAGSPVVPPTQEALDKQEPKIISNQHQRARSLEQVAPSLSSSVVGQSADQQSAVITKLLRVTDIKDAPVVESTIASLNLTQQQLANIQAQATSTRECRRNALQLTKALFNHLAEDQKSVSESWPKLYARMSEDDCARKRMIDVVNALSGFRSEATSIRRDNVEFAFAMDDLRAKVLENEVDKPLTFDKQFIEVEQFLQQSVKLMLANIDPERARLTSMRYRSIMPGPMSADDQCIELHQRLMAKNYPTDCNPNQFGQLPDVLRMAASSLELWSIESELAKQAAKAHEYPSSASGPSNVQGKQDVNECIANLVSS